MAHLDQFLAEFGERIKEIGGRINRANHEMIKIWRIKVIGFHMMP